MDQPCAGSVPVIDISPFMSGERDGQQGVAALVRQACERIGFVTITGHGVPPSRLTTPRR